MPYGNFFNKFLDAGPNNGSGKPVAGSSRCCTLGCGPILQFSVQAKHGNFPAFR
jgi:hypothetical protein